ncbi:hypothetical protein J2W30_005385 [Variovorax boronicumulans]|uniref:hypothetical protein n=1 Tax=Variovorax TaxID=34072 RepID=UPI0027894F24|nr:MULTISPECIES: hypothetical protein [Variovorax]MDQ0037608.1 hypothetical protein [Variovorax boronicumulans]MDQ0605975.1 hypothetical protein [Variovorax sp. W1I1]
MSLRGAWSRVEALRHESVESDSLLMRAALIGCVPILLAYGCAGIVYGNLPMMTPAGFIDMPGACAWLAAAMAFALAIFAIDWLVRGELTPPQTQPQVIVVTKRWSRGSYTRTVMPPHVFPEPRSSLLRIGCLGVAAVACASALVGRATLALGWQAFARPGGLAPQAEWPLYPLQWIWPWLLPLARRPVVLGLIGAGAVLLAAAYFMNWRKVRGAWFPFLTVLPMLLTLNYLGDAGFDFAAARGLGGLVEPELVSALAADAGRYNAFNFLSLWGGLGFGTVGLIIGFWFGRSRVMDED